MTAPTNERAGSLGPLLGPGPVVGVLYLWPDRRAVLTGKRYGGEGRALAVTPMKRWDGKPTGAWRMGMVRYVMVRMERPKPATVVVEVLRDDHLRMHDEQGCWKANVKVVVGHSDEVEWPTAEWEDAREYERMRRMGGQ